MAVPTSEQILAQGGGNPVVIDGVLYQPVFDSSGQGETFQQGPLTQILAYKQGETDPGQMYTTYSPTMQEVGTGQFQEVGNIGDMLGTAAKDWAPLVLAALGANAIGAGLGQESLFGSLFSSAPAGSLTAGMTPEAIAAAETGLPAASGSTLSGAPMTTTLGTPMAELTSGGLMTGSGAPTALSEAALGGTGALSSAMSSLSPTALNAIKALVSSGLLGGAVSGGGSGPGGPSAVPTATPPKMDAGYLNAVQQYYNTFMPQTPRDVATPLQQWYEGKFGG